MVGYIVPNSDELKVKDLRIYRAFYCGVCRDIKKNFGQIPRFALSYEMTFLAILLTSLYDDRTSAQKLSCAVHPAQRRYCVRNKYTDYSANMCMILSYHNLLDNWTDEKDRKSLFAAKFLRKSYEKAALKYPRQTKAVIKCVRDTHKVEKSGIYEVDLASGLTGHMLEEIFKINDNDIWNRDLALMGFYLGKFIYLMDAYDDVEKDEKNGSYNTFALSYKKASFREDSRKILTMMAAEASSSFERLPVVEYVDILRNILYSGMWAKFNFKSENAKKGKCNGSL